MVNSFLWARWTTAVTTTTKNNKKGKYHVKGCSEKKPIKWTETSHAKAMPTGEKKNMVVWWVNGVYVLMSPSQAAT